MNIREIKNLTENQVRSEALEHLVLKEHDVYLVDLGESFGYSALVFKEGKHIHYANDYELHHRGESRKDLREIYIKQMNNKLFTENEILEPIKDYRDLEKKRYFLHNYYPMRKPGISIFCINPTEEQQREFEEKTKGMYYDKYAFAFFDDKEFVDRHIGLCDSLEKAVDNLASNYEYWKSAIKYEMWNHEYIYDNYQGNWDVLSAFGNITYDEDDRPEFYMKQLGWNDVQKRAFYDARREYYKENEDA